jgi:hypothetical protein
VLFRCVTSRASEWMKDFQDAWQFAQRESQTRAPSPPVEWLTLNRWKLRSAIIPSSIERYVGENPLFRKKLHIALVSLLARVMQTRGRLRVNRGAPQGIPESWRPWREVTPRTSADTPSGTTNTNASSSGTSLSQLRQEAGKEIAAWLRNNKNITRTKPEKGEPTLALLILWELDHGRGPSTGNKTVSFQRALHDAAFVVSPPSLDRLNVSPCLKN